MFRVLAEALKVRKFKLNYRSTLKVAILRHFLSCAKIIHIIYDYSVFKGMNLDLIFLSWWCFADIPETAVVPKITHCAVYMTKRVFSGPASAGS